MRTRRALRRRLRDESGVTLTELMVAMVVAGIILTAFLAVLSQASLTIEKETDRTTTNETMMAVTMVKPSSSVNSLRALLIGPITPPGGACTDRPSTGFGWPRSW